MKCPTRWILAMAAACAISSLAMYRVAYHRGYEGGYRNGTVNAIGLGRFDQSTAFLAALQQLRSGDVPHATRLMETMCFDSAHIFYQAPFPAGKVSQWGQTQGLAMYPNAATARQLALGLAKYRAAYRTNSADWDDMERKLAIELAEAK